MKSGLFDSMAPNARRAFAVSIVLATVATLLYLFAVEPADAELAKQKARLAELDQNLQRITADLRARENVKKTLDTLEEAKKPYDEAMLAPLLGSLAMRAKTILDPLVLGAGLTEVNYEEAPERALPLTKPIIPKQLHTRAAVKVTAKGSYQGAVSFLLRLERDYPLVSLQAFDFAVAQGRNSTQDLTFVLEWPAVGKVTRK